MDLFTSHTTAILANTVAPALPKQGKRNSKVKDPEVFRASWNEVNTISFINLCVAARVKEGNSSAENSGFKCAVWSSILAEFNRDNGVTYDKSSLMSKFCDLKAKFKVFETLKKNSGFGWDERLKIPTAPESVWDEYIDSHKDAAPYRYKTLPHYQELVSLFSGKFANGKLSSSSTSVSEEATNKETSDEVEDEDGVSTLTTQHGKGDKPPRKRRGKFDDVIHILNNIRSDSLNKRSATQVAMAELDKLLESKFHGLVSTKQKLAMKRAFVASTEAELFVGLSEEEREEWIRDTM